MKRAVGLVALILVLGILAVWWLANSRPQLRQGMPLLPAGVSPPLVTGATGPVLANGPAPAPVEASPAFRAFLEKDSKLLNSTHVDTAAAEARENAQAASMGNAEISYARELALNEKANGNERVLAVDLLARVGFPRAAPALEDLITNGMNSARAQPHTVEEISNVQAKSFAIMAVDSIASRAAKDPSARDELVRLGSQAKDSTIQKYILGKIRSLPPL